MVQNDIKHVGNENQGKRDYVSVPNRCQGQHIIALVQLTVWKHSIVMSVRLCAAKMHNTLRATCPAAGLTGKQGKQHKYANTQAKIAEQPARQFCRQAWSNKHHCIGLVKQGHEAKRGDGRQGCSVDVLAIDVKGR